MQNQSAEIIKNLEECMAEIITSMEQEQVGSEDYSRLLGLLDTELTDDANKKRRWFEPVKSDTVISGILSLAGIVLIMKYEEFDAITTKAFGIATKLIGR